MSRLSPEEVRVLEALAGGIIPADQRDAGGRNAGTRIADRIANGINADLYHQGLREACTLAPRSIPSLDSAELDALLNDLRARAEAFFRQLRMDVAAIYLNDPAVWQGIGFPGPSVMSGGYPDFDQPQTAVHARLKEPLYMTSNYILPSVQTFLDRPGKMLIGADWRDASDRKRMNSFDPATGQVIGSF